VAFAVPGFAFDGAAAAGAAPGLALVVADPVVGLDVGAMPARTGGTAPGLTPEGAAPGGGVPGFAGAATGLPGMGGYGFD